MQVDCYNRNFGTTICSKKCKFIGECVRQRVKELQHIDAKKRKVKHDEELIG